MFGFRYEKQLLVFVYISYFSDFNHLNLSTGLRLAETASFHRYTFINHFPFLFLNPYTPKLILVTLCDRQIHIPFLLLQNTSARNYVTTLCVFQLSQKHGPKIKVAFATKLERIPWLAFMWLNVRVKGHETTMGNNGNIVVAE